MIDFPLLPNFYEIIYYADDLKITAERIPHNARRWGIFSGLLSPVYLLIISQIPAELNGLPIMPDSTPRPSPLGDGTLFQIGIKGAHLSPQTPPPTPKWRW
jgi:hypothetical protein